MKPHRWIRHPDLGVTRLVPATAVPIHAAGGWLALTEDERDAHEDALRAARRPPAPAADTTPDSGADRRPDSSSTDLGESDPT